MKFKKIITISLLIFATAYFVVNLKNQMNKIENNYEEVIGDPLKARIYTLENGLKVYLTSYDDAPRIQTNIAVRAGSKNDPENATGLAHYLEHMLFKGTDVFGSLDFNKEGPLIEEIEALYEQYRTVAMTDTANRERIYRKIDSISAEAAKYAIANEYDKMALGIGAKGTNAYTSFEKTVYINDIPSNQLENWLKLESERFRYPVFRLFHTELEAVYEEKNRDSDGSKLFESLFDGLFPNHQYGQQTTIGTVEHLKNPSLKEIRAYFNKYYVPNNMAICLSGDFDYDETIRLIQKYWSKFERKEDPIFNVYKESPIKKTVIKEVFGPEAESLFVGFRFEGANSNDSKILTMIDMVLANSTKPNPSSPILFLITLDLKNMIILMILIIAALNVVGLLLEDKKNPNLSAQYFGFVSAKENGEIIIKKVEPNSITDQNRIAPDDKIIKINDKKIDGNLSDIFKDCKKEVTLTIKKKFSQKSISLSVGNYYQLLEIIKNKNATDEQLTLRKVWCNN